MIEGGRGILSAFLYVNQGATVMSKKALGKSLNMKRVHKYPHHPSTRTSSGQNIEGGSHQRCQGKVGFWIFFVGLILGPLCADDNVGFFFPLLAHTTLGGVKGVVGGGVTEGKVVESDLF